jgi:hypothetical protein
MRSTDTETLTAEGSTPPIAPASATQVRAVYEVMRLLRRDSQAGADEIWCESCRRSRDSGGSAVYEDRTLCNGCATDFELQRLARIVRDLDDYLTFGSRTR